MKKYILIAIILLVAAGCSPTEKNIVKTTEQKEVNAGPVKVDRNTYLDSNEFIQEYKFTTDSNGADILTTKMDNDFAQMKFSEQYLYLIDFYERYNDYYGNLHSSTFLNRLEVYLEDTEFPTYTVFLKTFEAVAVSINIDREIKGKTGDDILHILDTLDKTEIMAGTDSGLTKAEKQSDLEAPFKMTIVTSSGEIKGAGTLLQTNIEQNSVTNTSTSDEETYINGVNGDGWLRLTDNQKFHGVSNALYSLDQNGYVIGESEYFYIDSLNAFYTDSSSLSVPVNEALVSIGIMSNTITK